MLLFAGLIIVYGVSTSSARSGLELLDPKMSEKTTPKFPIENELKLTLAGRDDKNVSGNRFGFDIESVRKRFSISKWECGVNNITRLITESKIQRHCPKMKLEINQCCIEHDVCYIMQYGRKFCDDAFCACLDVATKSNRICHRREATGFCELAQKFGETAYIKAGMLVILSF